MASLEPMRVLIMITATATVLVSPDAHGQVVRWTVHGDTGGGPPKCAASAVGAIDLFFRAMRTADSVALSKAVAKRFVFSTGKWTPRDTFAQLETVPELVQYARKRVRAQERVVLQSVQFNFWRGRELHFGPLYFERTAPDLGIEARSAVGKGMYMCGEGIAVLNLGRPALDRLSKRDDR